MNTPEHGNLMDGLNASDGKKGRSHGIHEARKHRNGCVSNLPRVHGVWGRGTVDSQMGAERRKQPANHQESPRAGDQLLRYRQRLLHWEERGDQWTRLAGLRESG